jgi:hypothetical protein
MRRAMFSVVVSLVLENDATFLEICYSRVKLQPPFKHCVTREFSAFSKEAQLVGKSEYG